MTPTERYHWQRKNRRVLYAVLGGLVIAVLVLRAALKVAL